MGGRASTIQLLPGGYKTVEQGSRETSDILGDKGN